MNHPKLLIVEDDPSSALTLEVALYELGYPKPDRVDNSTQALALIRREPPDLILMDIDIKGELTGIEVARRVQHLEIPIIFITGYDTADVYEKAKETNPYAYLIKPFNNLTLDSTLKTALKSAKLQKESKSEEEDFILKDCIFVKNGAILQKVKFREIQWILSEGNYCILHTEQKKHAVRISLARIIQRVPPNIFVRVHQRYLVQAALINSIDTQKGEILIGDETIPMGRTFKDDLLDLLNKI